MKPKDKLQVLLCVIAFVVPATLVGILGYSTVSATASANARYNATCGPATLTSGTGFTASYDVGDTTTGAITGTLVAPACGTNDNGTANVWDRVDWSGTISGAATPKWQVDLTGKVKAEVKVLHYTTCATAGGHDGEPPDTTYHTFASCKLYRECPGLSAPQVATVGDTASRAYDQEDSGTRSCYVLFTDTPNTVTPPDIEVKASFTQDGAGLSFMYIIQHSGYMTIDRGHGVELRSNASVETAVSGQVIPFDGVTPITSKTPNAAAFVLK